MPIKPENKHLYPSNWKEISEIIRFGRAKNRCENCGVFNHSYINRHTRKPCLQGEDEAIMVVLTVAHLDHDPTNCNFENLMAMCQKCHNTYDGQHRAITRANARNKNVKQISIEL